MTHIEACIFDLDGVIVDTARYHFLAWKSICDDMDIAFTMEDNERLKGVSRVRCLEILLELGNKHLSSDEKEAYLKVKNERYLDYIHKMNPTEILPGVIDFIGDLKEKKIKVGLGSGSKNAKTVLNVLNIDSLFDARVDGNDIARSKPDPEVFLKGAEHLNVHPMNCVVFEDSVAGIEAANTGGFISVGVGDEHVLKAADIHIQGFSNFTHTQLLQNLPIRS